MQFYQTLPQALSAVANCTSEDKGYVFLENNGKTHLTFRSLYIKAGQFAARLQRLGVKPGDRLVLVLPTGVAFAEAFYGAQLAGAVPCVVASPASAASPGDGISRVAKITEHIEASYILTLAAETSLLSATDMPAPVVTIEEVHAMPRQTLNAAEITENDLAFIQATSGSTGRPKCVMIRHKDVLANLEQIGRSLKVNNDVVVSWLPLFHDMGLVGCFLLTLYWQLSGVFMDQVAFLRRPSNWLQAISEFGGTLSPAPNFAYALVARRVRESEALQYDLSSWRGAMCGAEPVEADTLRSFIERFTRSGFSEETFVPCYGMAETTLAVTMHPVGNPVTVDRISYKSLTEQGLAVPAEYGEEGDRVVELTSCGPTVDGATVRIVDDAGEAIGERIVGHIEIATPSLTSGYYNDPEKTAAVLKDGWLRSGDLGYLVNGELYIAGRAKELIIIRGQKFMPADFEQAAAQVEGVSRGRVVAFGVKDPILATEGLYLVCESPARPGADLNALRQKVTEMVAEATGVYPTHVGIVPRNMVPRTTSGKLQRGRARQLYLAYLESMNLSEREGA